MPNVVDNVTVRVQSRSGFDKSRKNIFTSGVGTITPVLSDLIIPNTDVSVRMAISASLPPLASETFMRASLKVEAFFVPLRILYGGFESWLTGAEVYKYTGTGMSSATPFRAQLPRMQIEAPGSGVPKLYGAGTLSDYLNVQVDDDTFQSQNQQIYVNLFPYLAYHRIYDDWYRNTKIQVPLFTQPATYQPSQQGATVRASFNLRHLPFLCFESIESLFLTSSFADGVRLGELRQRNYGSDYFTIATPQAQMGAPMTVQTDATGKFSIAALRSSNSIQQWEELQNLTGTRIQDYCKANYGAHLSAGISQRAVYLGSADYPVYSKGVYANQAVAATNNPFTTVGARYGAAYASGSDFVVRAHFDEPGIFMILSTLVPEANYSGRVSALMQKFTQLGSLVDLPNPMLQNVGNEEIRISELDDEVDFSDDSLIFGFVPRYTWHKTALNEVHGLLVKGQSLQSFVAQRNFGAGNPTISTNFLQVRTSDLDGVTAVSGDLSRYGVWVDSYIQYFASMPLAKYSLPSLQNPAYEHGKPVSLHINGSKID